MPAATATMIATAEHLLLQLPGGAKPGDDRTETPPAQYWRRWSEDAAPPSSGPARAAPPSPAQPDAPPPVALPPIVGNGDEPPYRVLIVEDDRAQALFAEGVLNGAGIEALVASEPREVMDIMTRTRPDLVLMDLHMPGMSGTELTAMIRQHEAFLHTPIVFLTGDPDPDKQFEVLEMGADDLLQKPIRPRHLVAAIESRVKRARALGKQRMSESSRHPATGLMARPHLLQRLAGRASRGAWRRRVFHRSGRQRHAARPLWLRPPRTPDDGRGPPDRRPRGRQPGDAAQRQRLPGVHAGRRRHAPGIAGPRVARRHRATHLRRRRHPLRLRATWVTRPCATASPMRAPRWKRRNSRRGQARSTPIGIAAFDPPDIAATSDLSDFLRDALADDRFELIYQPIVAVAGGDEAQYQTLLRMHAPDGSLHNAAEIVPAGGSLRTIHDIDRWVLERALDVLQQRRAQGRPVRPVRTAVAAHAGARCLCGLAGLGNRGARTGRPLARHRRAPGRCPHPLRHAAPVLRGDGAGGRAVLPEPVRTQSRRRFAALAVARSVTCACPRVMRWARKRRDARCDAHLHRSRAPPGPAGDRTQRRRAAGGGDVVDERHRFHPGQPRAAGGERARLRLQERGALMADFNQAANTAPSRWLTARWLALGAAAGAALSLLLEATGLEGPWQTAALLFVLTALVALVIVVWVLHRRDAQMAAISERAKRGRPKSTRCNARSRATTNSSNS
jgi:CheY-like chemotaxis protein